MTIKQVPSLLKAHVWCKLLSSLGTLNLAYDHSDSKYFGKMPLISANLDFLFSRPSSSSSWAIFYSSSVNLMPFNVSYLAACTANMWTVLLSRLEHASHLLPISKHKEYMSALSAPLLNSWTGCPDSVEWILINVPFWLAVASNVPEKLRHIADKDA